MQRSVTLFLVTAIVCLVVDVNADHCSQEFFNQQPGWVTHAEWFDEKLLFLDNLRNEVRTYKQDGRPAPPIGGMNEALAAYPEKLLELKRQGDVWFLRFNPVSFVRVDDEHGASDLLNLVGTKVDFEEDGVTKTAEIGQVYDWVPAGDEIVLLGDLLREGFPREDPASWISGVVRLKLSDGKALAVEGKGTLLGEPWPVTAVTWRRHRVILPTLAAAEDGRIFFLKLDDTPRIYLKRPGDTSFTKKLEPTSGKLGAASPPDIPDESLRKLTLIMAGLEKTPFVAGLYFWEGDLYVLHRESSKTRLTKWSLIKVDPDAGETLGRSTLPTRANHLVVAPGDTWAFVEKGPYLGPGNQKILSVYMITADVIREFRPTLCPSGN